MSTVFEAKPPGAQNVADISSKLEFQKQLQAVTNKIHATSNVDEIMLEVFEEEDEAELERTINHLSRMTERWLKIGETAAKRSSGE